MNETETSEALGVPVDQDAAAVEQDAAPEPTEAPQERALQDWELQTIEDKNALDAKLTKLVTWMDGPAYRALMPVDHDRFTRQRLYMACYSNVLFEQVHAFNHVGALRALTYPAVWVIKD